MCVSPAVVGYLSVKAIKPLLCAVYVLLHVCDTVFLLTVFEDEGLSSATATAVVLLFALWSASNSEAGRLIDLFIIYIITLWNLCWP